MKTKIKKNNALTNARELPNLAMSRKLINHIWAMYEEQGEEINTSYYELLQVLDLKNTGDNYKRVIKSLEQLFKIISFENNGQWIKAPFIVFLSGSKSDDILRIGVNEKLLKAIKNTPHYTILNAKLLNRFSSNYAIVIYEMYMRYKGFSNTVFKQKNLVGMIYNLEQMNKKFGTNYDTRNLNKGIKRGILEIEKKTNIKIFFLYLREKKTFNFAWYKSKKVTPKK